MRFGTKASEAPAGTGGAGGGYIKYFKNGETRVRFLEQLDDWTIYYEHFDKEAQRSFPCTGDKSTCPGCVEKAALEDAGKEAWGAQRRYLVNCFNPDTGYVDLYKVPTSLIDDLSRYADKDGGVITMRDYTVVRYKKKDENNKVAYSVDKEEKDPVDLSDYADQMKDHQEALNQAYAEVHGTVPDDDDNEPKPKAKAKVKKDPARPKVVPGVEHVEKKKVQKKAPKPLPTEEDEPPSEPAQEPVEPAQEPDDDQGEEEIEEDDLRKMSAPELKGLFGQCGLDAPDTDDPVLLADALIIALGE